MSATTSQNFLSMTLVFTAVYICAGTSCLPTNTNIKMQEGENALHEAKLFQVDTNVVCDGASAVKIPAANIPVSSH